MKTVAAAIEFGTSKITTLIAENSGYKVAVAPEGQDFRLSLSK